MHTLVLPARCIPSRPLAAMLCLFALAVALGGGRAATARTTLPTTGDGVAADYLAAYARLDLEALAPFWTEESVWSDPTGGEIGAFTSPVQGAQAIGAHLAAQTAGVLDFRIDFEEPFESAGIVVAIGNLRYDLELTPPDAEPRLASFDVRTVVVLELRDGKVVRHTDYADFRTWRAQLQDALR